MSLQRKVTDFLALERGTSGTSAALTAGALALAVLAGTAALAGPEDCPPYKGWYHVDNGGHDDHADTYTDSHTDQCEYDDLYLDH